ncbi:RNA-directed DNA polymerase, eukaryota [Tanacetum coccineum]|uniref:RNA-directed DNA polymerase, eukaryota n=1 Tax=Tanacetum coccineum TaxID=301880 RepID=A0ABQ4YX12_9ASTR
MVWEYLSYVINQWNGNVVVMGDFNEVRYKSDRFGSVFNVQGAEEFNAFIADVGLEEVPLGGSSFTWCHKSATKMSKLDRFFVSNSLLNSCPHFSAITLERFLSDHRPILLREINFDYGPTPFRFFHHWIELDGFSNFVSDVWKSAPGGDSVRFKEELRVLDEKIDKKDGSNELVQRRTDLIKNINHLDQIRSMDLAQKSKMAIRGVMVDGEWIDDPMNVKREFFNHFRDRFSKPVDHRISIEMQYPKQLSYEQQADLERMVTKEELKAAVWDYGTDK